jgi:uncharacterized protein (TIGR02145 family)
MKNKYHLLLFGIGFTSLIYAQNVTIGNQVWMTENLNVDKFSSGDIISEAKTDEAWIKAGENKQPAWCYYDNDPQKGDKYGKLYNWYAVADARGLCPAGWHAPSDDDWTVLTDYLRGEAAAEQLQQMEVLKEPFALTNDDTLFVNANSDGYYREVNIKRGAVNSTLDSLIFNGTVGNVYGPFVDGDEIKLVKHIGFVMSADSVQARHILFSTSNDGGLTTEQAMEKADSVIRLVESGADFASLARELSEDQGSKSQGGDLGMFAEGMMVPEFNDACFNGNEGDLVTVLTMFGAHVVEIIKKKDLLQKARVVFLTRKINYVHKMKSASRWEEPYNGDNSSGFNGLLAGYRGSSGSFYSNFNIGIWWSSTEFSTCDAWCRALVYYYGDVYRCLNFHDLKEGGYSVRCLRD